MATVPVVACAAAVWLWPLLQCGYSLCYSVCSCGVAVAAAAACLGAFDVLYLMCLSTAIG